MLLIDLKLDRSATDENIFFSFFLFFFFFFEGRRGAGIDFLL